MRRFLPWFLITTSLTGCSLAPDFKLPELNLPASFKEQPAQAAPAIEEEKGNWKLAEPMEKADRGQWWKIFGDEQLNELQKQALEANQSLKSASARVEQARATAESVSYTFLPDLDIGANAVRTRPSVASTAGFGGPPSTNMKPFTRFSGQGVVSYEADLFGRVRDNYHAISHDAEAEAATYRSTLLALQADVAQHYFSLRAVDSERQLLRDTVKIRAEAARIMQHKYDVGTAGEPDLTRTLSELATSKAELIGLDRQRAVLEHALAVLLGKMPSEFMFAEAPLIGMPPAVPAGLPSSLLERRPDIASAQSLMAAANNRIGVARAAFFPRISLTASGGFESLSLADLFLWSNRTWALGQMAGSAITMPIFDSGRLFDKLDIAHASYDESLANYRQQVLVAFRDVEDNLAGQRLLGEQSAQLDAAAAASGRTTEVIQLRYREGDVDFFEVVNAQRDSLATGRAAVQIRGQRFITTLSLIRALGGGWEDAMPAAPAIEEPIAPEAAPVATPATEEKPAPDTGALQDMPLITPLLDDAPTTQKSE